MYMCVLICAYTICFKISSSLHHIDTLCANHVTFKVHGSIYFPHTSTLNTWLCDIITRWYSTRCDSTVSYTQEQVCYFTTGDCCRVFLLRLMYESLETAVIINLVLDIRLDGLCLAMHECL